MEKEFRTNMTAAVFGGLNIKYRPTYSVQISMKLTPSEYSTLDKN